jgi:hypothetical protein
MTAVAASRLRLSICGRLKKFNDMRSSHFGDGSGNDCRIDGANSADLIFQTT